MSILDKSFRYVPAAKTDIRKTFRRIREELKAKEQEARRNAEEAAAKTLRMRRA